MNKKIKQKKHQHRQRSISLILIIVLVISAMIVPMQMIFAKEKQISDYFFIQLYDSEDQVVATYKVTLTGSFSGVSSRIDYVEISYESGDECETSYSVDGNKVVVTVTHPTEGVLEKTLVLNANGTFFGW